MYSSHLLKLKSDQNVGRGRHFDSRLPICVLVRERERLLSRFPGDPTVEIFGLRRKDVLRGAGNAWTPVLRSFDKLCEVGDLSYLGFTLYLSVL